jgi:predicted metal-binding membrane protein
MTSATEAKVLDRDRAVVLATVVVLAGLAWIYLWAEAGRMEAMPAGGLMMGSPGNPGMSAMQPWTVPSLLLTFLMWSVMMVGMMLPSAAPAILLYGSLARKNRGARSTVGSIGNFIAGYVVVWVMFSLAATFLQAAFQSGRLLTPAMASASVWLSGILFISAGIYQWLPIKNACLKRCRTPLQFFMFRWRPGAAGAFRMGMEHGTFCVGCCWALMLLLFTAGVMNLLWVALIAAFVFMEKLVPAGALVGRLTGVGLVLFGGGVIVVDAFAG